MFDDLLPDLSEGTDHQVLLSLIAQRVQEILDQDAGLLFSYMYRLDIDEHRLQHVIQNYIGQDRIVALAQLILQRQIKRVQLRERYRKENQSNIDI